MEIYLVGGAVRDKLLGRPVKENDWVVVGSTPEEMLAKGFRPIGKDFPVFLHPETHEEYALARTERKTAKGYHGFEFYAAPDVTLEEDLKRRDLTINAIAQAQDGHLIDPFGGQADIKAKVFRHVSQAFEEDPVRLLRVCRFSSVFEDFSLAPETLSLLKKMVDKGEVDALVAERVWKELHGALQQARPERFFYFLDKSSAFSHIFKEVSDISQLSPLKIAAKLSQNTSIRFAAAFGQLTIEKLEALCQRMRIPNDYADLATLLARHYQRCERLDTKSAEASLTLLEKLDPFRRPERFNHFLLASQAIYQNKRLNQTFAQAEWLETAFQRCRNIDTSAIDKSQAGIEIAKQIRQLRLNALR